MVLPFGIALELTYEAAKILWYTGQCAGSAAYHTANWALGRQPEKSPEEKAKEEEERRKEAAERRLETMEKEVSQMYGLVQRIDRENNAVDSGELSRNEGSGSSLRRYSF